MLRRLVLVGLVIGGVAGCGRGPRVQTAPDPMVLLTRARNEFRRGKFPQALLSFQKLTFELGGAQEHLAEVRYSMAECYFQTGDRVTAAHEFRRVADDFPESPYAPQALLRAGDANLRLWRRAELDPSYGEAALAIYQELAGRFPTSDASARAGIHVRQLKEQLAEKSYKNGMFYLRRRAYDSAIIYFKDVIASYPETERVPLALQRLIDSYRAIGYKEELQETCAHLQRFYPQTPGLLESCPAGAP